VIGGKMIRMHHYLKSFYNYWYEIFLDCLDVVRVNEIISGEKKNKNKNKKQETNTKVNLHSASHETLFSSSI
jgi:hypothetical protein